MILTGKVARGSSCSGAAERRAPGFFAFRGWFGLDIEPRPGDGRISRADAARLARVKPDTISQWIARGYITDVRREGRSVWLNPVEIIEAEERLHKIERNRFEFVLGIAEEPDAPPQAAPERPGFRRIAGRLLGISA